MKQKSEFSSIIMAFMVFLIIMTFKKVFWVDRRVWSRWNRCNHKC